MPNAESIRSLPVKLTTDELLSRADALAKKCAEIVALDAEKKEIADTMKSRASRLAAEQAALARVVADRCEDRPVAVVERKDFDRSRVVTIRMDTGAEVDSRPMSAEDLQAELFRQADEANDPAPAKGRRTKATA